MMLGRRRGKSGRRNVGSQRQHHHLRGRSEEEEEPPLIPCFSNPNLSPHVELPRDDKLPFVVAREHRYELPFVLARADFVNY
jgi:hypothetical protein